MVEQSLAPVGIPDGGSGSVECGTSGYKPGPGENIFLFVNPSSGGNMGAQYMKLKSPLTIDLNFQLNGAPTPPCPEATLHLFNIRDGKPGNKEGFKQLKEHIANYKDKNLVQNMTRIIVCGGDGTVMWACTEIESHQIDFEMCGVGVIPFGTGNDFSRTFGWGPSARQPIIGKDNYGLIRTARTWVTAGKVRHDLFNCEIMTQPEGDFKFVTRASKCCGSADKGLNDGLRGQHGITDLLEGGMKLRKPVINYFSFGYESKTGLGLEKHRTTSWLGNLAVYAKEGHKKIFCSRAPLVNDVMDKMTTIAKKTDGSDGEEKIVANFGPTASEPKVIRNPINIILLNTLTIGRGVKAWNGAKGNCIQGQNEDEKKELMGSVQKMGDKCAYMLCYNKILSFSWDIVLAGVLGMNNSIAPRNGFRLAKTSNDVCLYFKDKNLAKYRKDGRVYAQIDGEFIVVKYPSKVRLSWRNFINVLAPAGIVETFQ